MRFRWLSNPLPLLGNFNSPHSHFKKLPFVLAKISSSKSSGYKGQLMSQTFRKGCTYQSAYNMAGSSETLFLACPPGCS